MSSRRPDDRRGDFKFQGLTNDEMRRRREETTIELRKSKREDSLNKRRNIVDSVDSPRSLDVVGASSSHASLASSFSQSADYLSRLGELTNQLLSTFSHDVLEACTAFRKLLSKEKNPPIKEVLDCGIVPRFVALLSGRDIPKDTPQDLAEKIIFESAWVLTNIASGASSQTMIVVNNDAVPVFIDLLRHSNKDICEQSIWALGNISGDSSQLRDYVLSNDIMMSLLKIIHDEMMSPSPILSLLRNAVWTLSNLCRGKPVPAWDQVSYTTIWDSYLGLRCAPHNFKSYSCK